MKIFAPAKINLGLKVLQKRSDGYHDIKTIMQQIGLKDILFLNHNATDFNIKCYGIKLDRKENLIYRAASLLKHQTGYFGGATITLYKNIPPGAGLAGGSSDAAATLIGLNSLWGLGLGWSDLKIIGGKLGADVPFCLQGGTVLAEGTGEKLTTLSNLPFFGLVMARPYELSVSTARIYQSMPPHSPPGKEIDFSSFVNFLDQKNKEKIIKWFAHEELNDLEKAALAIYPQIQDLKKVFKQIGLIPVMSGSGPTVFSLVNNIKTAFQKASFLENQGYQAWASWIED